MIINDNEYELDEKEIIKYLIYLKKNLNKEEKDLTLVFVDNEYIKRLNKEFRNKDYITDVLTFTENIENYLGDVIIAYPKAIEQAREYNHSVKREVYFLITHGFLHLLGYDHQTQEDEQKMFKKQNELLESYGIGRENGE